MAASPFTKSRPLLGEVQVLVPLSVIQSLKEECHRDNVASFALPGDVGGRVCVHLRNSVVGFQHFNALVVTVEGLAEGADVLCRGQLQWVTVDWEDDTYDDAIGGSTSDVWLHGNGCLANLMAGHTNRISGTVTVYGPARQPPPDYSALRGLAALCDVTLRAAGSDFPAHRAVLAARSPVFLAMLAGGFKEAEDKVVNLAADCSSEAFRLFLVFVYSGVLGERRCAELVALLGLAECYQVAELKEECVRQLLAVGAEEALLVVEAALQQPFLPEEVSRRAGRVIRENWRAVRGSADWARFAEARPDVALTMEIMADEAPCS